MEQSGGKRIERTKTEINLLNKEAGSAETLSHHTKQLVAKDSSHGLLSATLVKGNGLEKVNVQNVSSKILNTTTPFSKSDVTYRKNVAVENIFNEGIWTEVVQDYNITEKNAYFNHSVSYGVTEQATDQQEEKNQEQGSFQNNVSAEVQYSSTSSASMLPASMYLSTRRSDTSTSFIEKGIQSITGKNPADPKSGNKNSETFCHNGRKFTVSKTIHCEGTYSALPNQKKFTIRCTSKIDKVNSICERNLGEKYSPGVEEYNKKQKQLNVTSKTENVLGEKTAGKGKIIAASYRKKEIPDKEDTFCHDGRKLNESVTKGNTHDMKSGVATSTSTQSSKKIESTLCAKYHALQKAENIVKNTGKNVGKAMVVAVESISKLSEEGNELQGISESAFVVEEAVRDKVANKTIVRKEKKRTDTLLTQKAEVTQLIMKKKMDGSALSPEEVTMLEKKLGIVNKTEKGEKNVSDKKSKQLKQTKNAEKKKLQNIERKMKNTRKKSSKELRKRNVSAQMRYQAKNYVIRKLMDPNNDTEGTGLGGVLLSAVKTRGFNILQRLFKAVGSILLKVAAPIIPVLLIVAIVPIIFMLLIAGIAGGDEQEQAQAQEQVEVDYNLSTLDKLYGHANKIITENEDIMKWEKTVKKELKKQGIDVSWTDMVLCMMWQESKGLGTDIMQSGGVTEKDSIIGGISVLKAALDKCAQYQSTDIRLVLYCYNYGPGFADYIYQEWDGICSEEAAQAKTDEMLAKHPELNAYGDPKYAEHVLQNYVFEQDPALKPDTSKWCQTDKDNVEKCSLTALTSYACKFIGNKYVWGGTSLTNGADCSGFTQQIYKHFGIDIPRTSGEQSKSGKKISTLSDAQPGDLFFYGDAGTVNHVALYLGNNTIVHASNSKPYPNGGIKTTSPADYRPIMAIRRYSK